MKKPLQHITVGAAVAAILGTAVMATYAPVARAADAQVDEIEEVTVTGSRIARPNFESNSPIVTVDSATLEQKTGLNIENFLNQMPNFNPASSPVTTQGDVQITPVNSVGVATISLRGFGPNRNLVLVDGHRPVPINALMVTDINGIPSALVERVEIISGGASATYGADAIGGVTNFILKKNFEGFEMDAQYGITEQGDGEEYRVFSVLGTNFADNRGNVTMALEYYNREASFERNRDFFTDSWSDPYVASNDLFVFGWNEISTGVIPGQTPNFVSPNAVNAIFSGRPTYPAGSGPGAGLTTSPCGFVSNPASACGGAAFRVNNDGSIFTLTGNNLYKFRQGGGVVDGREYAYQRAYDTTLAVRGQEFDTLKYNNQEVMVGGPQDRFSIFSSGTFDITDNVQFFARGNWNQSKTRTLLLGTNATGGWAAAIPYNPTYDSPVNPALDYTNAAQVAAILANPAAFANPNYIPTGVADPDGAGPLRGSQHPVTLESAILLNSRPTQAGSWILQTYPLDSFDQRATLNTNTVWQIEAGLNIDLPIKDWTSEIYYSHGQSATYNNAFGNNSLSRWRVLVSQNDYGRNTTLESNTAATSPTPTTGAGFGGASIRCTSGFYGMIFAGDERPSEDCRNAVIANLQSRTNNIQDVAELNVQGGLFDMWAGEVRAAAGVQWRKNSSQFIPDILQSTSSFLDQVIGVYPTGYLDAEVTVKDYYAEFLVPVVSDLPFLKRMELELGGRYSDYSDTDSTWTYKATTNIQFNDWLRLRGGYNRATRAPNLGELFLNEQEIFAIGGANFGDPCSGRSNAPYGAGGVAPDPNITPGELPTQLAAGQTVEGATSAYLLCQAMMGAEGRDAFYGGPGGVPPGVNATQGGGAVFNWILQEGNPELDSEVADTWTAGIVFTPVSDNPWFSRMSASIDWWKVDIADAIQQYSVDYANYRCFGTELVTTAAEAATQAATLGCRNVGRNTATGAALTAKVAYDNQATISTSGIDFQFNWFAQFEDLGASSIPGGLGLNVMAGWLDYYKTKQSPLAIDVETDWKGTLGPSLSGTNPGAYDYRLNASLNYSLNPFSVSLRWRFLPSVWGAAIASQEAIIANNERVAATGVGTMLSYTPSTAIKAESYNIFDLSFNWTVNDTVSLRAGIDNLFDVQPVITGASAGRPFDPSKTDAQNAADTLTSVCSTEALAKGCVNPGGFSLPSTGAGGTSPGYYDTLGRRFFMGVKVRF